MGPRSLAFPAFVSALSFALCACPPALDSDRPKELGEECAANDACASGRCGSLDLGATRVCVDVACLEDIDCFGGRCVDSGDCGAQCVTPALEGAECTRPTANVTACTAPLLCDEGLECSVNPLEPDDELGVCVVGALGQACVPALFEEDGCTGGLVCDGVTEVCALPCDADGLCDAGRVCSDGCAACVDVGAEGDVCFVAPYDGADIACVGAQRDCDDGLECGVEALRGIDVVVFTCGPRGDAGAGCNPHVLDFADGCAAGLVCDPPDEGSGSGTCR